MLSTNEKDVALKHFSIFAIAMIATGLAACSPSDQTETISAGSEPVLASSMQSEAIAEVTGETVGGDGSSIQMDTLTQADIEGANLGGELACSFTTGNTPPLLLATGVVGSDDPAFGVVKIAGYVERIAAPGGFEGITNDPTFTGQGKTIKIAITGAPVGGGESPYRPARLTYMRADGASLTMDGRWNCGP